MHHVSQENLPFVGSSHKFVGAEQGDTGVSVFLFQCKPGPGGKPGSGRVRTGTLTGGASPSPTGANPSPTGANPSPTGASPSPTAASPSPYRGKPRLEGRGKPLPYNSEHDV
jgi:hypothetical protein